MSVGDDGADGVADILCRKVEAQSDLGRARRLLMPLRPHDAVAGVTQLDAGGGVDGVVDAAVQGDEAAEQLAVGCIDDGIDPKPRDVALPHLQALALRLHDTLVGHLPLQLPVLPPQKLLGGGQWPYRYSRFYQRIFAIEFSILRIGECPIPSIIDIVNSIRLAKGNVFAEWKNSETAKFFEDHGYKNKKESSGYFF